MKDKVEKAIEEVKPYLQTDGGDIELISVENGVVQVRLKGTCAGCPMSKMTLQWGVERFLRSKIPEVRRVEAI